ncbi:MAG: hypothetical protein ABIQ27_07140 [Flavobacterium sp.]|uniref:hypothetical protein n=1 Tax=Flavobacterium sp. TaxID=239 RepID=UPI003263EEDC
MAWEWLSSIKNITEIVSSFGELAKNNRATKDMLIRELKLNIKGFETAQNNKTINYDKLLSLLKNDRIQKARESRFTFATLKKGVIENKHIKDDRNKKYRGKSAEWLFKNIDEKIDDLRNQKQYHSSLENIDKSIIALQFSNLFYKMKLLAEFINS